MRESKMGFVYILITVLFFSTFEAVGKTITGQVDAFQCTFLRFLLGGIVLFLILLAKRNLSIGLRDALVLLGIGILNVVISMNAIQLAVFRPGASAAMVAIIFSSNPIFVSIFSAIIEKERIDLPKILGLLLGLAGIIIAFADKLSSLGGELISPLLALVSAVVYGLYTVLGKGIAERVGSLKMNAYSFILGSLAMLPFLLITKKPVFAFQISALPQILYLSVFVTGIAYLTYFVGLKMTGASKGSLVFFLKPVLASVIAVIFLGEHLSVYLIFGTVCVLAGITVVLYGSRIFRRKLE